jgi:hypothetical protein
VCVLCAGDEAEWHKWSQVGDPVMRFELRCCFQLCTGLFQLRMFHMSVSQVKKQNGTSGPKWVTQ